MSLTKLETSQKRKFIFLKIYNVKIKLQRDTRPDITIINEQTGRKMGKSSLLTAKKIAHRVSRKKLNFWGEFTGNIFLVKLKNLLCLY